MSFLIYNKTKIEIAGLHENPLLPTDTYIQEIAEIIRKWDKRNNCFRIITSGSTGTPKIITFKRVQLIASALQTAEFFHLLPGDNLLSCLPVSHVAGYMMIIRSLVTGMNMIIVKPSGNPLLEIDQSYSADFAAFIPLQLINIIHDSPDKLGYINQMKAIMVGGGRMTEQLLQNIDLISSPVYETFGMTETLTHIALKRINGKNPDKYFHPIPGVEIRSDAENRLIIKSSVTLYKELLTNDLVKINSDHSFEWIGRYDYVVNSGGFKIQLEKAEEKIAKILTSFNIQNSFFLYAEKHKKLGEALILVIEQPTRMKYSENQIMEKLKSSLPLYEIPKKIYFMKKFVRTALGKINRNETMKQLTGNYNS